MIQVYRLYQDINGRIVKEGVYQSNDPKLHGLGQYLVDNGFATLLEADAPKTFKISGLVVTEDVKKLIEDAGDIDIKRFQYLYNGLGIYEITESDVELFNIFVNMKVPPLKYSVYDDPIRLHKVKGMIADGSVSPTDLSLEDANEIRAELGIPENTEPIQPTPDLEFTQYALDLLAENDIKTDDGLQLVLAHFADNADIDKIGVAQAREYLASLE